MPTTATPINATTFAKAVAASANGQYNSFHQFSESDPELSAQIKIYWNELHMAAAAQVSQFPGVSTAWSAVFVSWNVMKGGATNADFHFAQRHSEFVQDAIRNPRAYRGRKLTDHAPRVGDILHNNRGGTRHDFAFAAANAQYDSHSAIVVLKGEDHNGKFVMTIGGNESDSVRMKRVALHGDGLVVQRTTDPYICILECVK